MVFDIHAYKCGYLRRTTWQYISAHIRVSLSLCQVSISPSCVLVTCLPHMLFRGRMKCSLVSLGRVGVEDKCWATDF